MPTLTELPAYARLPLDVVHAEGDTLHLADGRTLLDLYGGHCVNLLGAGDAALGAVLQEQWTQLSFATNLLPLAARAEFCAALAPNLPTGDWRAFLSNSGAEANEALVRAALAATGRDTIVCFSGAFHGRSGGVSCLNDGGATGLPSTPYVVRRAPWGDLDAVAAAVDGDVAGVLLEPLQSMAGVVAPPPGFLEALRARCDAAGARLLFDEVQSGSGRLGTPWAAQHFGVVPDGFSTAKGVGAGFPVGLTVLASDLAEQLPPGLFGSTFGGGPLALAAATHVAQRVAAPGFLDQVRARGRAFQSLAGVGPVLRVRGAGLLLGLELEAGLTAQDAQRALLDAGVLVGTSRDPRVLRLSPALTVEAAAPERLGQALASLTLTPA